jgi:hypothetical protein
MAWQSFTTAIRRTARQIDDVKLRSLVDVLSATTPFRCAPITI